MHTILPVLSHAAASEITEAALLRDILFVFQGIDGRYIRFDPVADRYSIDRHVGVPQATRDIVGKLAELGCKRISTGRAAKLSMLRPCPRPHSTPRPIPP